MAAATSTHATNVHLIKDLSYDPTKNFTPIVKSVETIGSLVVNRSVVPVNSVAELVEYAKQNPGKLSFGSSGVGSFFHLAGALFNQTAQDSGPHWKRCSPRRLSSKKNGYRSLDVLPNTGTQNSFVALGTKVSTGV